MKLHNVEQRSEAWFKLRTEYPLTASEAQAIGNGAKGLDTLCWEKVAEKHSKASKDNVSNEHTERGVELEPQARSLYELETGNEVVEAGFITNDKYPLAGISPDGLVDIKGQFGLIEIKCFDDAKHLRFSVEKEIESKYLWQMQMQMLISERIWCDFVAFNPNFEKSLVIVRVVRDEKMIADLIEGIKKGGEIIKSIESKIK